MRVRVYFNLHLRQFSVQYKGPSGWRVAQHLKRLSLRDVRFWVSPAGRARVLREKRKNVHAYVEGTLGGRPWLGFPAGGGTLQDVHYNPYRSGNFQHLDLPVYGADELWLFCEAGKPCMLAQNPHYCFLDSTEDCQNSDLMLT